VAAPILVLALLIVAACETSKTAHDGDTVSGDNDSSVQEGDLLTTDDTIPMDDDALLTETDQPLVPDADTSLCADLKVYENVKKAGFPLKDTNGKITFCRPGCDTPTENDPQCARNIWDWRNWQRYQNYKNGTKNYHECYPWPCTLPEMQAFPVSYSECDHDLTLNGYSASSGVLYDLRLEKDMIGIEMESTDSAQLIHYDIKKDAYANVAPNGHAAGYRSEQFFFYVIFNDYYTEGEVGYSYILSAKKNTTGYRYEVIYDDEQHQAYFSRPPLVGDKWVVLNISHRATGIIEVVYSKVDEWKWHDLKFGKIYEGNVVGGRLTFINDNREVYVCDLDKLPFDPAKECLRINREGEMAYQPRLNEENNNQLVYFAGVGQYGLTLVDLSSAKPTYTLLPVVPSEKEPMGIEPEQFKGNLISYIDMFIPENSSRKDYKSCFYRIDTKKQYCPTKPSFKDGRYDMGFNSFDGNYQLWKAPASINARFRDIACYCEKEGICPLAGLK